MATELDRLKRLEMAAVMERDELHNRALAALTTLNRPIELQAQFTKDHPGVSGDELQRLEGRVLFLEESARPKLLNAEKKNVTQQYKLTRKGVVEKLKELKNSIQGAMARAYSKLPKYKKWVKQGNNNPVDHTKEPKPTSIGLFRWAFGEQQPLRAPPSPTKPAAPAGRRR